MSLKELMREKQAARSGNVSHPAAVYNSVGKLTCKICQMIVGSDALWPAHIRSSVHVQKVEALKAPAGGQPQGKKTTAQSVPQPKVVPPVAAKAALPAGFFDDDAPVAPVVAKPKPAASVPQSGPGGRAAPVPIAKPTPPPPAPPAAKARAPSTTPAVAQGPSAPVAVPVGFFDDVNADAAARNTTVDDEKKRKLEEEWEAFQDFAATVPEPVDDTEETAAEDEIEKEVSVANEQLGYLKRLLALHEKSGDARMSETRANVAAASVDVDVDEPEPALPAAAGLSTAAIAAMLRAKRARVDAPVPKPLNAEEEEEEEEEEEDDLLNWRGRRM